jgi:hypothetical protein
MNKELLKKIQHLTSRGNKKLFGDTFSTDELKVAMGYSLIKTRSILKDMLVSGDVQIVKVEGKMMGGFGRNFTFTRYKFIRKEK